MLHRYGKVLGEAGNGVSKNISHNVIKKRRSEAVKKDRSNQKHVDGSDG